jgi:hydroxyacylglutathione hydrolase
MSAASMPCAARLQGPVYGPAREKIPEPFEPLNHGDRIEVLGLRFEVIDVPGHTAGHIAYLTPTARHAAAVLRRHAVQRRLRPAVRRHAGADARVARAAALPGDTRVCCTHEYTLSNLKFAAAVEPGNTAIAAHLQHCQALRAAGQMPTLPSSHRAGAPDQPFPALCEPAVVDAAQAQGAADRTPVPVFAALREWKNRFR